MEVGELKPGARLVNRSLAAEFGVSFAPVREAISRLRSEGLVEQISGAGAFVREFSLRDLEELYILREAIESCACAEAAQHGSPVQLDALDEINKQAWEIVRQLAPDATEPPSKELHDAWLDNEEKFHDLLLDASRNQLLTKVLREHRTIHHVFSAVRGQASLLTFEVGEVTCLDRDLLLTAIRNREADDARETMAKMIRRGRHTVLTFLQANSKRTV